MRGLQIGAGVLFLLAVVLFCNSCTVIQPGYVGMRVTAGQAWMGEMRPGMYFVFPFFERVVSIDTRVRSYPVNKADAMSYQNQQIYADISIQHSLDETMAAEVYVAFGDMDKVDANIIAPVVEDALKATTAKYETEQLIQNRAAVKEELTSLIRERVRHLLANKNSEIADAVHIANVSMTNFEFGQAYKDSVERKMVAEQEAFRAQKEAEKQRTMADAAAYSLAAESKARADAIKREAEALAQNPNLTKLRAIEKWNGVLPHFNGGQAPIPFIEIDK